MSQDRNFENGQATASVRAGTAPSEGGVQDVRITPELAQRLGYDYVKRDKQDQNILTISTEPLPANASAE